MKKYKIELLKKEFGFLDLIGNLKNVDEILVKKGDKNLLAQVGGVWEERHTKIYSLYYFAVWKDGGEWKVDQFDWSEGEETSPTIGEQLFAKKLSTDFVIECEFDDRENYRFGTAQNNAPPREKWVIYKMRDFDLVNYHRLEIDKAAATLKTEISAI